jgi:hypothetical protein
MKGASQIILSAFCLGALTAGAAAASIAGARLRVAAAEPVAAPVEAPRPEIDLADASLVGDRARLERLDNVALCQQALEAAGVSFAEVAPEHQGQCGYDEAISVSASELVSMNGQEMPMACALAARLEVWRENVVEPAAMAAFGQPVAKIEAFGTYSCRQRADGHGNLSEHAFAKAADISGFRLADGRRISVAGDFNDESRAGAFLREIHDKACDVFDVTLGPRYNADHHDHFHLDVGGETACR